MQTDCISFIYLFPPKGQNQLETTIDINDKKEVQIDSLFLRKQKKGFIDVWWLYDDGGLTLLLPYIIGTHNQWKDCKLRVFALVNKKSELDQEQRNMAALLSKFRIDFSDVILITDILKPPQESSKEEFRKLISKYVIEDSDVDSKEKDNNDYNELSITEADVLAFRDKVSLVSYFWCSNRNLFRLIVIFGLGNCCWTTLRTRNWLSCKKF